MDVGHPLVNTKDYSKEKGGEELRRGREAYELEKYDLAVVSFSVAAKDGNAEAMYRLGKCYWDGIGISRDKTKAVSHFLDAERAGYYIDAQTQFEVGRSFFSGDGVKEDHSEAMKWFRKAAEQGHTGAKEILGPVDLSCGATEVTVRVSGGGKLDLVKVEAGSFEMSARDGENDSDEVSHRATLTKDFYIGRTEVTQAQWKAVMGSNPSNFKGDDLPVEYVSWNDAMEFCEKLNDSGKAPRGWKFTLPTETQWEYAARGGKKSKGYKYSGSDKADEVAWYYENSGDSRLSDSSWGYDKRDSNHCRTHPVGKKKANELDLYDMSGNVWEWCLDNWKDKSDKATVEFARGNDQGGSGRVRRDGGWVNRARDCRSARRISLDPGIRGSDLGFRVALVPESY